MNKRVTKVLGTAIAVAGLVVSATSAHASLKCKETLTNQSAKLTQTIAKVLQKCSQGVQDGKITGPCPDTAKGQPAIDKAKSKLKAAIVKDCTGSTGEFPFGRCPNEVTSGPAVCTNILIHSESDIGDCLNCLADHNATELEKVLYGSLLPESSKDIAKCQKAVGQTTTGLYIATSKAMASCQLSVLKGKIPGPCPDALKAQVAIDKAESKKVATITKDCCGADGVCGDNSRCTASATLVCIGGTNSGTACTVASECPGGGLCTTTQVICVGGSSPGKACTLSSDCPGGGTCVSTSQVADVCEGGTNDHADCTVASECPGGTCNTGPAKCEAASDCGRCRGGTTPGLDCRSNGECHSNPGACDTGINECVGGSNDGSACHLKCTGGTNAGALCAVASECPSGACNGAIDCPSIGGGTCIGVVDFCKGSDDLRPIQDLGYPSPCPGLTAGGAPIELMGQTGKGLLGCVDPQASDRATCQVDAGAPFFNSGFINPLCIEAVSECTADGGHATVTVAFASPVDLGGISISLGYDQNVMLPGHGEVAFPGLVTNLQSGASIVAEDRDDALITSLTNPSGLTVGNSYTVQFSTCAGAPVAADFACVVRSASDLNGVEVLDGVSCSVASIS